MQIPVLALLIVLSLSCGAAQADVVPAPQVLVSQSFDAQVPGDVPDGWRKLWGDSGDDLLVVSNVFAVSGKNSLLFDRVSGTNTAQWGFGRPFSDIASGWCVVSFSFLVEGAGNDTAIGIEVRDSGGGNSRSSIAGIGRLKVIVNSPDYSHDTLIGAYSPGVWQRLTLWAPTREGKQTETCALLEALDGAGKWHQVGNPVTVPSKPFDKPYGFFQVNAAPNKRGFRLYVDDLSVERREGNHP
ncbi:MAG TPA: hypothetical protein VGK19_19470 [Capsulimonadaceae bacterium]